MEKEEEFFELKLLHQRLSSQLNFISLGGPGAQERFVALLSERDAIFEKAKALSDELLSDAPRVESPLRSLRSKRDLEMGGAIAVAKAKMAKKKKFKYEIHNERPSRIPLKSREIPATAGLLFDVRDELKSEVVSVRQELIALRLEMKSWGEFFKNKLHQGAILTETQEGRNRYVLDGYEQIFRRQSKLEKRMQKMEKIWAGYVRAAKKA